MNSREGARAHQRGLLALAVLLASGPRSDLGTWVAPPVLATVDEPPGFQPVVENDPKRWRSFGQEAPAGDEESTWHAALGKADEEVARLETLSEKGSPRRQIDLALARQARAKALMHLQRAGEAVSELEEVERGLSRVAAQLECEHREETDSCHDVFALTGRTHGLLSEAQEATGDLERAESHIQQAVAFAGSDMQGAARDKLFSFYGRHERFDQALSATLRGAGDAPMESAAVERLSARVSKVFADLFERISWDPATGKRIDEDARDYFDEISIGIGKKSPYGMTNFDEDFACFFSMVLFPQLQDAGAALDAEHDAARYVNEQSAGGNIEPALKYVCAAYLLYFAGTELCRKEHASLLVRSSGVLENARTAAKKIGEGGLPANSKQILNAGAAIASFLDARCADRMR